MASVRNPQSVFGPQGGFGPRAAFGQQDGFGPHPARRGGMARGWDPFREFDAMRRQMTGILEPAGAGGDVPDWIPPVDLEETEAAYIIETELPGVSREDITIDLDGQDLTIKGDVAEREHSGVMHRRARRTGAFGYRVSLPQEIAEDGVSASLADGVLRVELTKITKPGPRRIEIAD